MLSTTLISTSVYFLPTTNKRDFILITKQANKRPQMLLHATTIRHNCMALRFKNPVVAILVNNRVIALKGFNILSQAYSKDLTLPWS